MQSKSKNNVINTKGQNPKPKKQQNKQVTKGTVRAKSKARSKPYKETFKMVRKELWTAVNGETEFDIQLKFNPDTYPPWFSKISQLFETYKIKYIKIHVTSFSSRLASGQYAYYIDVNPNDRPTGIENICAQAGHHSSYIAKNSVTHYGGGMFRQYPRYATHATDIYPFTFYMSLKSNEPVNMQIQIEYSVTLYTPQLNASNTINMLLPDINGDAYAYQVGNTDNQNIKVKKGQLFSISSDAQHATVTVKGITEKLFEHIEDVHIDAVQVRSAAAQLFADAKQVLLETIDNTQAHILDNLADLVRDKIRINTSGDGQSLESVWTITGRALTDFVINTGTRAVLNSFVGYALDKM